MTDMRTLTGKSRIAGVFGWPVDHSRSPRLHGYWLREFGIDGAYIPFATHPSKLEQGIRALPALGFRGGNITLPHKERALSLVDEATTLARRIGAINMLVVREDGTILGDNSDGFGFIANLQQFQPDWRGAAGPALLLGAGGAARAIVVALLDAGVPEILLVNSTNLGMAGRAPLELDLRNLPKEAVVYDIVYVPLMTELLKAAQQRGNKIVDGIGMLLHQGRPGFKIWFGQDPQV